MEGTEKKKIRFIDPHYNDLFSINDGEPIIITTARGEKLERECHYIDDYHTKIGYPIYHICEFAERMQENGNTFEPKAGRTERDKGQPGDTGRHKQKNEKDIKGTKQKNRSRER